MATLQLNRHLGVVLDGVLNLSVASSSATNSIHKKTQEGETTLQHTEIVAGFLRKMFYPIFIIALMTVFTSCRDDENNISSIGENYSPLMMSTFSDGNTYTLTDFTYNSNDSLIVDDYLIAQLGIAHNYYLEKFIENFDYSASDYYEEFTDGVINANISLDKLSLTYRQTMLNKFSSNGEYDALILDDIITLISNSNLSDKTTLINYFENISDYVANDSNSYSSLCAILNSYKDVATYNLCDTSLIILKSFIETLKASGYFWYPTDRGGSGIGYTHIVAIMDSSLNVKNGNSFQGQDNSNKLATEKTIGDALIADASSMSVGMIGVAVVGALGGPVGAIALAVVAGESAVNSGLAAIISGSGGSPGSGGGNKGGGGNGGSGGGGNNGGSGGGGNNGGSGGKK